MEPHYERKLGGFLRELAGKLAGGATGIDWHKKLAPHIKTYVPEGEGPFPTAVLLHGCTGDFDHLERWGRFLAQHGYLAYTVDSLTPRSINYFQAGCFVCTGIKLQGKERCQDIDVALDLIAKDPRADKNRIHLLGWSHGGWTIMEWLHERPVPAGMNIASAVFTYPYCGLANIIHHKDWTHTMPVMFTTAGWDMVVGNRRTLALKDRLIQQGINVTHNHVERVAHGFDVQKPLIYDARRTRELQDAVVDFMKRVA